MVVGVEGMFVLDIKIVNPDKRESAGMEVSEAASFDRECDAPLTISVVRLGTLPR